MLWAQQGALEVLLCAPEQGTTRAVQSLPFVHTHKVQNPAVTEHITVTPRVTFIFLLLGHAGSPI